jgi:hypothetical protein
MASKQKNFNKEKVAPSTEEPIINKENNILIVSDISSPERPSYYEGETTYQYVFRVYGKETLSYYNVLKTIMNRSHEEALEKAIKWAEGNNVK